MTPSTVPPLRRRCCRRRCRRCVPPPVPPPAPPVRPPPVPLLRRCCYVVHVACRRARSPPSVPAFADGAADAAPPRAPADEVGGPGPPRGSPNPARLARSARPRRSLPGPRTVRASSAGPARSAAVLGALRALSAAAPPPPGPRKLVGAAVLRAAASAAPRPTDTPARNPSATSTNPTSTLVARLVRRGSSHSSSRKSPSTSSTSSKAGWAATGSVACSSCGPVMRAGPRVRRSVHGSPAMAVSPGRALAGPSAEPERRGERAEHRQRGDRPDRGRAEPAASTAPPRPAPSAPAIPATEMLTAATSPAPGCPTCAMSHVWRIGTTTNVAAPSTTRPDERGGLVAQEDALGQQDQGQHRERHGQHPGDGRGRHPPGEHVARDRAEAVADQRDADPFRAEPGDGAEHGRHVGEHRDEAGERQQRDREPGEHRPVRQQARDVAQAARRRPRPGSAGRRRARRRAPRRPAPRRGRTWRATRTPGRRARPPAGR